MSGIGLGLRCLPVRSVARDRHPSHLSQGDCMGEKDTCPHLLNQASQDCLLAISCYPTREWTKNYPCQEQTCSRIGETASPNEQQQQQRHRLIKNKEQTSNISASSTAFRSIYATSSIINISTMSPTAPKSFEDKLAQYFGLFKGTDASYSVRYQVKHLFDELFHKHLIVVFGDKSSNKEGLRQHHDKLLRNDATVLDVQ
jgi:hypothetical protein